MKRIIVVTLILIVVGCGTVRSLLHMGSSTWLECHDADGKPIHAEDDTSTEAVACREAFGAE